MGTVVDRVVVHYHKAIEAGDPRTADWPFMLTPWPTLGLVFLYVMTVLVGPRVMKNRDAFDIKGVLVVYNFGLVLLSLYMFCEFLLSIASIPGFYFWCQNIDDGRHSGVMRLASVNWLFFVSKFVEFFDTIFFILRKKNNQISFLHVYHHISVCILWWVVVKWSPGGSTFFGGAVNSFVHVIMYFYYMVSALGPQYRKYLWWKKYLTSLQLLQFASILVYISHALTLKECSIPKWVFGAFFCYSITLILLFLNYFIQEYIHRAKAKEERKSV